MFPKCETPCVPEGQSGNAVGQKWADIGHAARFFLLSTVGQTKSILRKVAIGTNLSIVSAAVSHICAYFKGRRIRYAKRRMGCYIRSVCTFLFFALQMTPASVPYLPPFTCMLYQLILLLLHYHAHVQRFTLDCTASGHAMLLKTALNRHTGMYAFTCTPAAQTHTHAWA